MIKSPRKALRNSVIFSSSRVMLAPSAVVRVFIRLLLVEKVIGLSKFFIRSLFVAHSGIRNVIARSEATKQVSREEIASSCALAMTIGLRGEFCAEHIQ